jgi:hypothetical protein
LANKIFPNKKTLLSGKKSSPTAQNPRTDGKVLLLAKGFFPNSIPVGKEKLLVKPRCGQTVGNRATMLLVKIALCQQHVHAVGKEFSFFPNFEFKLFW